MGRQVGCAERRAAVQSAGLSVVVSQPRLSRGKRESGQIPIIISFLTRQEFLGVLIDLVTNGSARLPFLACCLQNEAYNGRPAYAEHIPIYVHTYSLDALLLSMQYQSLMGI